MRGIYHIKIGTFCHILGELEPPDSSALIRHLSLIVLNLGWFAVRPVAEGNSVKEKNASVLNRFGVRQLAVIWVFLSPFQQFSFYSVFRWYNGHFIIHLFWSEFSFAVCTYLHFKVILMKNFFYFILKYSQLFSGVFLTKLFFSFIKEIFSPKIQNNSKLRWCSMADRNLLHTKPSTAATLLRLEFHTCRREFHIGAEFPTKCHAKLELLHRWDLKMHLKLSFNMKQFPGTSLRS